MIYNEINGDLIKLALHKKFDVIAHGCNCFNIQKAGIAKQMANTFYTDCFDLESHEYTKGDINKLGNIDYKELFIENELTSFHPNHALDNQNSIIVVNAYTQYYPGSDAKYWAIESCLYKLNIIFKGKHIGLPKIGCGIGGLDWEIVKSIIQKVISDCKVTIINYES